jgi:hypothetical protein
MRRAGIRGLPVLVVAWAALLAVPPVHAQETERCFFLCVPDLKIEPTVTFEPIFRRPTLEMLEGDEALGRFQPETEAVFEMILAVGVPTTIPRIGFTFETIFVPFGETTTNPFTGTSASDVGRASIRDNEIQVELELNIGLLEPEDTGGWIESHFDIVDKISAAARPSDTSTYTHKLNFEWDTAFLVFKELGEGNYLRNVEIEGSLDYVATGLPRAGDVIDGVRYVTGESPWSFSLVFVFPLAPL